MRWIPLRPRRMALLAVVCAVASGVLTAGAAQALNTASYWNTSSSPQVISGYGSTAKSYGYVKVNNGSNGTRLYNYGWNKFTDADNHRAYLTGESQWNAGSCANLSVTVMLKGVNVAALTSCAREFYGGASLKALGLNYTRQTWTAYPTASAAPNNGSDRGRAHIKTCIDVPARIDPCTGYTDSTADTF